MSDILDATRDYLLTQAGVTALAGNRIYWTELPQGATLEAIVLELTGSAVEDRHLTATGSHYRASVNVLCYGATHTEAAALAEAVYTALEFDTGTWGSVTVTRCFVEQRHELTDAPRDGSEAFTHIVALMCVMWHK